MPHTTPSHNSAAQGDAAAAAKRRQKPISFQKMAMIQEELAKVEAHLELLRSKGPGNASFSGPPAPGSPSAHPAVPGALTTEEAIDPNLVYMLIVELCQLCASGDAVGVRILLNGGADPDSRDYDDRTLLHIACMNGRTSVVKVLLEFGADCMTRDRDGKTPIDVAEESGFTAIARIFMAWLGHAADGDDVNPDFFAGDPSASSPTSSSSQQHPDFSSVPQPMVGSLVVIMVGLPGRGKSYVAQQIRRYFQWSGLSCNIFSHQTYKRGVEREVFASKSPAVTSMAPPVAGAAAAAAATTPVLTPAVASSISVEVEARVIQALAADLTKFVHMTGGVAILDGTQTTFARRQALLRAMKETLRIRQSRVIFVEIVNNNREDVHQNILRAQENLPNPPSDFVEQYYHIMAQHEVVYKTLNPTTDRDLSYIRIEDNTTYSLNMITGWMPTRLAYMLHNLSHAPKNLYLTRSGEYVDMVAGRIGGNSQLTERGLAYSVALFNFFRAEVNPPEPLAVLTSCSKRCTQTVHYFAEEAMRHAPPGSTPTEPTEPMTLNCRVSYFPTLDDLNHGDCEGQLLSDVRKTMPNTLQAMRADPYYTAWPNGECIHQVFNARLEPHIHDIQASSCPVLVVSHLHLLQGLYSYFVTAPDKTVAPQNAYKIDIPYESVLRIRMVGTERVADIIDLSAEVDKIMRARSGMSNSTVRPKDDFHIFRLFRPAFAESTTGNTKRSSGNAKQQQQPAIDKKTKK